MSDPSILIIDDDTAVREAVAEDLKREGYQLHFANNGRQGLEQVQVVSPTVIILDLRMPVMDGHEFLSQLSLKPSDPYSVVVLSAYGDADSLKSAYESGVSSFIKKPFNLFEIRGVVRNAIAIKQLSTRLDELVQERTTELEQRLREITALNRFFQRHLDWRSQVDTHYHEVVSEIRRIAKDLKAVADRARTDAFIALGEMPRMDSDETEDTDATGTEPEI